MNAQNLVKTLVLLLFSTLRFSPPGVTGLFGTPSTERREELQMNRDQKPFALPLLLVVLLSCTRVPAAAMPGGASVQGVAYAEDRSTSEPPV